MAYEPQLSHPRSDRVANVEHEAPAIAKRVVNVDSNGNVVGVNYPLSTNGDSVYCKDIWEEESITTNWDDTDGAGIDIACIPFTNLHTRITNSTSDNPKTLFIHFQRSVIMNVVGLGCTGGGDFSNIKIETITSGGIATTVFDDSADGTKYTTRTIQLPVTIGANAIRFTFATADPVCLSNIFIPKTESVVARLQATKPDNTVTDINATAGGNLKTSVEEGDNEAAPVHMYITDDTVGTKANVEQIDGTTDDLHNKYGLVTASALYGRNNGKVVPLIADKSSSALVSIDFAHHEIHEGDHYFIKNFTIISGSGVLDFLAVTPNTTKWAHMLVQFSFEAEANIVIYEGATTSADGSAVISYNRNRNSANTAAVILYTGPTVTTTGTQISAYKTGSGKLTGGESRASAELILKQNTKYLIRVTNDTVSNNWVDYLADWYEHTDNN